MRYMYENLQDFGKFFSLIEKQSRAMWQKNQKRRVETEEKK